MDSESPDTKKKYRIDDKPNIQDSLVISDDSITVLTESVTQVTSVSESVTQVTSVSEQTPTEDTHSTNFEDVFPKKVIGGVTGAISCSRECSVEKDQPKPLGPLLPPSVGACTVYEENQSFKSQESTKTTTLYTEPDSVDICAAILMACLFCHPLDCLLATMRGCNACAWSLCSSLCSCQPSSLQPFLDITHHCDFCGCWGICCCQCECSICEICLQATECLDLAMEISQMLYH